MKKAYEDGKLNIPKRELRWLDIMSQQLEEVPDDEEEFWNKMKEELDLSRFIPEEYGLTHSS